MTDAISFAEPQFLWLLIAPSVLLVLWVWRLVRHAHDRRGFRRHRRLPVRERLTLFGGLLFWLCLTGALALTIAAMARPTAVVPLPRAAGATEGARRIGASRTKLTRLLTAFSSSFFGSREAT